MGIGESMNYAQCTVCGKKVTIDKEKFAEHQDKRGNVCYGSYTPAQNFDPFKVKRSIPQNPNQWPVFPGSNPVGGEIPLDPTIPDMPGTMPEYNYEYNGGGLDDEAFLNELREMT